MESKPKVLLIVDCPNWAFEGQANGLIRNSKLTIDYTLGYMNTIHKLDTSKYDIILPWGLLGATSRLYQKQMIPGKYVSLCHHFPFNAGLIHEVSEEYVKQEIIVIKNAARHAFISKKLKKHWEDKYDLSNVYYLPAGIDTDLFAPKGILKNPGIINVGYVSNFDKSVKRFHTVVKPAMNRIMRDFPRVRFLAKGYNNLVPHIEMPKLINQFDLYICGSSYEGLPTVGVEAASCGIGLVSTNVGVIPELNIHGHNVVVLGTVDGLYQGIAKMIRNPQRMKLAGEMNRKVIMAGWSWQEIAAEMWEYWILGWMKCFREIEQKREKNLKCLR